jgi:vacuolar-type H+-ATPase subunit D/Vma8
MIAANKQNLLLIKGQRKSVDNGLRLLREKRSGLVIMFLKLANEGKQKQKQLSKNWLIFLNLIKKNLSLLNIKELLNQLNPKLSTKLTLKYKNVTGVHLNQLDFAIDNQPRNSLKTNLKNSLSDFNGIFPDFIKLAQLKTNCLKIATEITKTNRQISNLETKLEVMQAEIKYINAALLERSNAEKAILIKIFG